MPSSLEESEGHDLLKQNINIRRDASRPLGGQDASGFSSRIRKFLICEEALGRGPEKVLEPPAQPHASHLLIGREVPIFHLQIGTPFSNLIFLTLFQKKFM
jgi:hypothetical protein